MPETGNERQTREFEWKKMARKPKNKMAGYAKEHKSTFCYGEGVLVEFQGKNFK